MQRRQLCWITLGFVAATAPAGARTPPGTAFSYQGQLRQSGSPVNATIAMSFSLWDAAVAGVQQGPTLVCDGVGANPPPITVSNGVFTVALDFGSIPYRANQARWLEVQVDGQPLSPRQPLTPAPFSLNTRGLNVDGSGRVGLGTASPSEQLHMFGGNLRIDDGEIRSWGPIVLRADVDLSGDNTISLIGKADVSSLVVDSDAANTGSTLNALRFGGSNSGEAIGSKRSTGGNRYGLDFYTAGANRMSVDVNGNVGIGTSAPTAKLDIAGSAKMSGFALTGNGAAAGAVLTSDANGNGSWAPPAASLWTVSGSNISYSAGSVGIGTTSPGTLLDIRGTGKDLLNVQSSATNGSWLYLRNTSTGGAQWQFVSTGSGNSEGAGNLLIRNGSQNALAIMSNGNVGIGTSAPGAPLELAGGTGPTSLRVLPGSLFGSGTANAVTLDIPGAAGTLGIWDSLRVANNLQTDGWLGIGRSPTIPLDISATGSSVARLQSSSTVGTWLDLSNTSGSGQQWSMISSGAANAEGAGHLLFRSSGGARMILDANGNLGINTDTPGGRLDAVSAAGHYATLGTANHGAVIANSNGNAAYIGGAGDVIYASAVNSTAFAVRGEHANGAYGGLGGRFTNGGQIGVYGYQPGNGSSDWAGFFYGDLRATDYFTAGLKSFEIDHPLDPENKILRHFCIESDQARNLYDGTVTTDAQGMATITLPGWFEALNQDFRYQLTVVDDGGSADFVLAKVVQKIHDRKFTIRTSQPNVEVSWQVTGVRHDAFVRSRTMTVEQDKLASERGFYLHPAAFGKTPAQSIDSRAREEYLNRTAAAHQN